MKNVIWKDKRGYRHRSMIKDNDPEDKAPLGIPNGPPDLERIDWEAAKLEVNDYLVQAGLFTWNDVELYQTGLTGAVNIFKRYLINLYRTEAKTKVPSP